MSTYLPCNGLWQWVWGEGIISIITSLHSAWEKQNGKKALHCIVYYNYWGVRSQIKKPILWAYTYGTTESVLLQLTPLLHQIFLQTIFDPGAQKEKNINMICDLQTPYNWTGVKIRYVHSTNTQDTDSLPIFPVHMTKITSVGDQIMS